MKIMIQSMICLLLIGCASTDSLKADLSKINEADGINEEEAIAIARMSMVNSKLDDDYHLWAVSTYDNGQGYWRVVFSSLYFNRHECVLIIEKSSGDILAFYEALEEKEAALGANPAYSIEDWRKLQKFE